jgi:hypothetical protein
MKVIKAIIGFFLFNWQSKYDYSCTDETLFNELKKLEKEKENIEGEIHKTNFDVLFISDFALSLPIGAKLPLLSVKGKLDTKDGIHRLRLYVNMQSFVKILFLAATLIILAFYFADKYYSNFGHISNSRLPLFVPIFVYVFLMLTFIIESAACNNYFDEFMNSLIGHNNAP